MILCKKSNIGHTHSFMILCKKSNTIRTTTKKQAFIGSTLCTHVVMAIAVCSHFAVETIIIITILLFGSLGALLQPLDNFELQHALSSSSASAKAATATLYCIAAMQSSNHNGEIAIDEEELSMVEEFGPQIIAARSGLMASLSAQSTMFKATLFLGCITYMMLHIPLDPQACKSQFVLLIACLDAFMLFGHLWDKVPTLQVVLNCRLVYVCLISVLNAALFVLWKQCVAVPFVPSPSF